MTSEVEESITKQDEEETDEGKTSKNNFKINDDEEGCDDKNEEQEDTSKHNKTQKLWRNEVK